MPRIEEGVYVEVVVHNIGAGSTARRQEIKNYFLAKSINENTVRIQLLDINNQPLQIKEELNFEDFQKRFTFQPNYLDSKKSDQDVKIDKAIAQAETHFRRKEYFSAEFEYDKAIKLDEENVRANFGVAKVYLARGEKEKAQATFEKLAKIEAVFEEKNKHIFNELGIELRRMRLFDQAIEYYRKALSFIQDDENLYFNIARACFEKGDLAATHTYLCQALAINPDMPEARKLIESLGHISDDRK